MTDKDSKKSPKKYYSKDEALSKLQRYCAYQDRCHSEVRAKLLNMAVYGDTLEEIISELIREDFLNEERFARSFARGKFRIKGWGRNKIKQELKSKRVSAYCIKKGLTEIDEAEYEKTLIKILEKKNRLIKPVNQYTRYQKLYAFAYNKGFEASYIKNAISDVLD